MLTFAGAVDETIMVIEAEVTEVGVAHGASEVKLQITTSLSFKVLEVKLLVLLPTINPFTIH